MTAITFARTVPVRHQVDVFIAGGGPAGIAAALAATGQGASVFIAEGQSCFGGMGTAALVPAFMCFGDGVNFLADGVGRRVYDLMWARGAVSLTDDRQRSAHSSLGIRAEGLKRIYDDLMVESGAEFSFHTQLVGVEAKDGRVSAAVCAAKSGLFAIEAAMYVDATGDGDLAAWAGAPFEKGDAEGNLMPGTLCSLWADIDWEAVHRDGTYPQNRVAEAIRDGVIEVDDPHLPGFWATGRHVGTGNIGHTFGVDHTDERSTTAALLYGRRLLAQYERFFKEYLKGYEHMELVATGSLLGVRETRRIMGDYVLCLDDFNARAVFDDEIGRYNYPVDVHMSKPSAGNFQAMWSEFHALRYGPGESYGIPYRCLVPRELTNVLVAGRCLSADRFLQGSARVMPGCFITGQAAGLAAALAAQQRTDARGIAVGELQQRLRGMGAYLPHA